MLRLRIDIDQVGVGATAQRSSFKMQARALVPSACKLAELCKHLE
jgi:hypothetical protein